MQDCIIISCQEFQCNNWEEWSDARKKLLQLVSLWKQHRTICILILPGCQLQRDWGVHTPSPCSEIWIPGLHEIVQAAFIFFFMFSSWFSHRHTCVCVWYWQQFVDSKKIVWIYLWGNNSKIVIFFYLWWLNSLNFSYFLWIFK